jgi:YidC/Oxa1 family membrane protein insertase
MSESQRIYLAFILCTAIFFGFQWLAPPAPPLETPDNSPQATAPLTGDGQASTDSVMPTGQTPPGAADGAPVAPPQAVPRVAAAERSFETPLLRGAVQNGSVGLSRLELVEFADRGDAPDGEAQPRVSLVPTQGPPLQAQLVWHLESGEQPPLDFVDPTGLHLAGQSSGGLSLDVTLKPRADAYGIDYTVRIANPTQAPHTVGASVWLGLVSKAAQESRQPGFIGKLFRRTPPADLGRPVYEEVTAVCEVAGKLKRKSFGDVKSHAWSVGERASWAGLDQQYFALAAMPEATATAAPPPAGACTVRAAGDVLSTRYIFASEPVPAGGVWERHFTLYAGPKRDAQLAQVAPVLRDIIDYSVLHVSLGFLARPMVWLLDRLNGLTGSWGLAIVLLTVTVKLALFPVTYKSLTSARRMQAIKPELDALKERFANDKERQQLEQLKLFKERGVNPVGGCLPMLMQMPVWITLYRTLWSDVDLYQQPFLWLNDLTAREPFPSLALAVGALTVLQQKVTPMPMDSQQAKVMTWVMPVMLTCFMVPLPSGLVLYILVNSILTILQQLAINKRAATA